jgi:hypothetical protein
MRRARRVWPAVAAVLLASVLTHAGGRPAGAATTLWNGTAAEEARIEGFATDSHGAHHLLVGGDFGTPTQYVTDATGAWARTTLPAATQFSGDLALDSAGHVFAVTAGGSSSKPADPFLWLSTNVDGPMETYPLGGAGEAWSTQVTVADNGTVYVAWMGRYYDNLWYATWSNGVWSTPVQVAPTIIPSQNASALNRYDVVVDGANTPHFIVSGVLPGLPRLGACPPDGTCTAMFTPNGQGGWTADRIGQLNGRIDARRVGASGIIATVSGTPVTVLTLANGTWTTEAIPNSVGRQIFAAPARMGPNGPVVFLNNADGPDRRIRRADRGAGGWTTTVLPYSAQDIFADVDAGNASHIGYDDGKWYDPYGSSFVTNVAAPDTHAPLLSGQRQRLRTNVIMGFTTAQGYISWSASDALSGIARYELSRRIGTGSWTSLSATLTSPAMTVTVTPGSTVYQFRMRGWDKAGNVSAWVYGASFTVPRYQNTSSSIVYGGYWATSSSSSYSGGSERYTGTGGRSATFTFTGRAFGWVASVGPSRGKARVYIDGTWITDVNLYSSSTTYRKVVYTYYWSTSGLHTFRIVDLGTAGHSRIDLDAILVVH